MTLKVFCSAFALCTFFVLPVSRPALARETINWLLPDVAPAFIRDGDQAEEGFGDRQLAYLINHLADVDHKHFFASTNRIWYQIGHADGNCTLTAKKTPSREKIAIFSQFGYWAVPNQMIVKSDRVSAFTASLDSGGQMDLSVLSQNDKVTGAYEAGAGYGAAIDRFIADPLRRTRLESVANFAQPIRLLSAGRIDFIFGTLIDINYRLRLAGSADPVTALKIRDAVVSTPEEWGYVACSNQATGRALIDRIDAILTPQGGHSAYLESLKHWYGPEDFETALRTGLQVK